MQTQMLLFRNSMPKPRKSMPKPRKHRLDRARPRQRPRQALQLIAALAIMLIGARWLVSALLGLA